MPENNRSTNSSETSKRVIFPRENTIFQEIEDPKTKKKDAKIDENLHAGSSFDFGGVSAGFGSGLGDENSWFSPLFRYFFEVKFEARFGLEKNREKWANKVEMTKFWAGAPVYGRLLGRTKEGL